MKSEARIEVSGPASRFTKTLHIPSYVPILNPIVRGLLRLGVPMGPMRLLTTRGRNTGKPRTNPVAIFERQGHHYLLSPYGQVNWVRNLRVHRDATLRRGWRKQEVKGVELNSEEAAPILKDAIQEYLPTRMGSMILRPNFDVEVDSPMHDFVFEARRHPVFEIVELPEGKRKTNHGSS